MRSLVTALVFLCAAAPCHAGDQRQANQLSPDEVRDGWILLFDGETTFGWKLGDKFGKHAGVKSIDGALQLENDAIIATTSRFDNCELRFDFRGKVSVNAIAGAVIVPGGNGWQKGTFTLIDLPHPSSIRFQAPQGPLSLRNIKVRPLKTKSLFDGKDLAGWKIFPGRKSKFKVDDGAITIVNGPGDLQTEGKYRDFILQLECKSNGKHLNSGVFFRCRDGEYQNGYEAQIHNRFTAEPKKEYTIDEYDPVTHKKTGRKKMKYQAVDYGTGAIYRRQPARREIAKDHEWFTMTVLAEGNHFAIWVNGIEVADWTDNRPLNDNARNGCRLAAGHISLQGHDPTTNLSFRNIRIAEFATPEK